MSFKVHQGSPATAPKMSLSPPDGSVFTGTDDRPHVRMSADGRRIDRVASTGGRPLGLELFDNGDLLVCDALAGLLVVHGRTVAVVLDGLAFANGVALSQDEQFVAAAETGARTRDPVVERLQTAPMALRKTVTRIPEKLQPKPKEDHPGPGIRRHRCAGPRHRPDRIGLSHGHRRP